MLALSKAETFRFTLNRVRPIRIHSPVFAPYYRGESPMQPDPSLDSTVAEHVQLVTVEIAEVSCVKSVAADGA